MEKVIRKYPKSLIPKLSVEIHSYKTAQELTKEIDDEIQRIKTLLGDYLRRLDEARARQEKLRKTQEALSKLTGGKLSAMKQTGETQELDLMGLRVVINASADEEASSLEESIKTLQDKLNTLQKVRKALEPLTSLEEVSSPLTVVKNDGVPTKIMLRL